MKKSSGWWVAAVLLFSWLIVSPPAQANVLGDMQTFSSNTDGLDFITVHSGRPLKKGWLGLNGHLTYARNHLILLDNFTTQGQFETDDQMTDLDFSLSYGLTKNLQLFFSNNILLWQKSEIISGFRVEITEGWNVLRPGVKWTLSEEYSFALLASVDILRVENNPYTGVDAKNIYNIELAKNFTTGSLLHGVNLGYRARSPSQQTFDGRMFPLDDQLTFSYGLTSSINEATRWVGEVIGSYPMKKEPYNDAMDASSLDLLLALHHSFSERFSMNGGATIEPVKGLAPDWRVFIGLTYYWNLNSRGDDGGAEMYKATTGTEEPPVAKPSKKKKGGGLLWTEPAPVAASTIRISPETAELFEGSRLAFTASGGNGPYTFTVLSGGGSINEGSGFYRAPLKASQVTVQVMDANGQTATAQVAVKKAPKADKDLRLKNLKFKFDTDILIASSQEEIERTVGILQRFRINRIIVEGHTDSKGTNEYNLNLSQSRAEAVKRILQKRLLLEDNQVEAIGFGEERPVATNNTDNGRQRNRRVDLKIYTKK